MTPLPRHIADTIVADPPSGEHADLGTNPNPLRLNSYDEWSALRAVIVGSGRHHPAHDRDLSFDLFLYENIVEDNDLAAKPWLRPPFTGPRQRIPIAQQYLDELDEDIAGLVTTLESVGITVHRPLELDPATTEIRTPAWSATMLPALNIRDSVIVLGDEIVETPPLMRARYFENQLLKPTFLEYFRRGARWSVMPRPVMTDGSFDFSYVAGSGSPDEPITVTTRPDDSPYRVGVEPMLDAAQIVRFGRDVLVNVSTAHHQLAFDWLERQFAGRLRFHRVYRLSDDHIDSTVVPLRPGLLLVRGPEVLDRLPRPLQRWDHICYPEPTGLPGYGPDDLVLASRYIDMNVLSIGPDTVLANPDHPALIRQLEAKRIDVIPVRHRHRRLFGGGFHCFTVDVVRDGEATDYFD